MNIDDGLYIGVDGCRGGWISCVLDHGELRFERFDAMEELVSRYPEFDAFLIDMAVGLRSSADQLRPDDLARKELGQKSSSIFPIPCRQLCMQIRKKNKSRPISGFLVKVFQNRPSISSRRSGNWMNF